MKQRLLYGILVLLVCISGSMRTWALEQDANGVYQIGTAQDLMDFAALVNGGSATAKAALTADIDLSTVLTEENLWVPIGKGVNYGGSFDGQGFKITGFTHEAVGDCSGLFGKAVNATIQNFSIEGYLMCAIGGTGAGMVGWSEGSTIRNVHSALEIETPETGLIHHVGGIVGGLRENTKVERCSFSGIIKVNEESHDCFGCIAGYTNTGTIRSCINYGKLLFQKTNCYAGGILGYLNNTGFNGIHDCVNVGLVNWVDIDGNSLGESSNGGAIIGYIKNCTPGNFGTNYWLDGSSFHADCGKVSPGTDVKVTAEELASGEVCFKLNGDQQDIAFYQTLGEDDYPTLDITHKLVYAVGERLCDGSYSGDVAYSNNPDGSGEIPDHQFDEGYCSVCGQLDMNYMTPVDGVFEIGTARQLRWFADYVNAGSFDANAKLTEDIDLSDEEQMSVIGNSTATAYKGVFDGQGYALTGFHLAVDEFVASYGYGLFGNTNGATIKNFSISGNISYENGGANPGDTGCGLVGWPDGGTLIQNIKSDIDIYANISSHVGGIVGSLRTATIDRCEYAGHLDGLSSANGTAGIAGYTNTGTITNCIFSGSIEGDGTGYFAGILGYVNNGSAKVMGCLSIGTIDNEFSQWTAAVLGRVRNIGTYANNFYNGEINGVGGGEAAQTEVVVKNTIQVTEEQLTSGEVAWELNGATYVIPAFYQTLGLDNAPVLDSAHDIVYPTVDGYASMQIDNPMDDFLQQFAELQNKLGEEVVATQQLIDDYLEATIPLANIDTYEAFVKAFAELKPLLDAIQESVNCYEEYIDACTAVADYMEKNEVEGKEFEQLNVYLTTDAEPSEEFANGTYLYIKRTHTLTNEQIEAEKTDVEARLQTAIAKNYKENTDITNMVVNANFADGTNGWETKSKPAVATVGNVTATEVTKTFTLTQTLTDLKEGIYLFGMNAAACAGGDLYNQYYSAQLTANDNMNYIQVLGEDVTEEKVADDDKDYLYIDVEGYVPATAQGFAYAMTANPNRYENFTAVRVTDGKLTFGIQNPGTGIGTDQVLMSGLRLVYLGKGDTECEGLNAVLEGYQKRAEIIINYEYSDAEDFAQYPNISAELKDALQACSDAVEDAKTGNEKIALVDRFSALMKEVYDCRKVYTELASAAEEMSLLADNLFYCGVITADVQDEICKLCDADWDAYRTGSLSLEEAKKAVKELREYGNLVPPTDEEGTYLISTPLHLAVFGAKVTGGETKINGKLVADIDLDGLEWQAIGEHGTGNPYAGTFDGQGHKITNLTITESDDYYNGLFAYVTGTVKNFSITGNISTGMADYVGVVGEVSGGKIENVHSSLNIIAGDGTKHTGGVTGGAINSALVTGCSFSGTLNVGANGDSFGGVIGYAAAMTMTECLFDGVVEGTENNEATYVGGLLGYANSTGAGLANNLAVGKVQLMNAGAVSGSFRSSTPGIYSNNFWMTGSATRGFNTDSDLPKVNENTFEVTAEQLASGEIAYKLNPLGEFYFYQTLSQDAYPVLDNTHAIVYPVGEFTCDGRAKGELSYSNDASGYKRDEHNYEGGVCSVCHMTPDGWFGIKTGGDLRLFANRVNAGEFTLNAKMVADIDLSEVITEADPWIPAGDWGQNSGISNAAYRGHFDGQGYTITGFNAISGMNYFGIFGVVSTDVIIENFTIYGTLVLKHKTGGVVGYTRDTETTIRNIHSYLNIENAAAGNRPGGILGSAVNGTTNIQNCTYSGTLSTDSGSADSGGNYGGIVGYVNNNTAAIVNITNCLFDGNVINTNAAPGGCTFGGFVGYSNSGIVTIKNCLSVGTVKSSVWGQYFGAVKQSKSALINCYYTGEIVNGSASTVEIPAISTTAEQLASGEICYLLNGDDQDENWNWYQTLTGDEKDAYPVLDNTHKPVLYNAYDGYHNPSKDEEDGIANVNDNDNENFNNVSIYNLAGQRMSKLQKGINIVGGKKILY